MRRSRTRRDDLPVNADINVTSLVDVAFTLLVIFIITAPALQGGMEIDVPEADVRPITAVDDPFFVSIDGDGTIYLGDDNAVTMDEFRAGFAQLNEAGTFERVYLRADSSVSWAPVLQVLSVFMTAGVDISTVAVPWQGN